jgi:hypothetical protein
MRPKSSMLIGVNHWRRQNIATMGSAGVLRRTLISAAIPNVTCFDYHFDRR